MTERKVGIVAECVVDLPKEYLVKHDIPVLYFTIEVDSGVFTDTDEVTAENILSYVKEGGKKAISSPSSIATYEKMIRESLKKYRDVVFISAGAGTSKSFSRACEAVKNLGNLGSNIHVVDSKLISSAEGLVLMRVVELAEKGASVEEIVKEVEAYREKISATFVVENADFLYRNGRVSARVKNFCATFNLHPVLCMKRGCMALKSIMLGSYENASLRYVRNELCKANKIDAKNVFLVHAGCTNKKIEQVRSEILKRIKPENLYVVSASASVSCNCGPGSFGVMFALK